MSRRYPGAKPFTREQQALFYGRDRDLEELYRLVSLESLVVLYGKSGLGKSSLLNAGLIPQLEEEPKNQPCLLRFQAWTEGNEASPLDKVVSELQQLPQDRTALDRLAPGDTSLWSQAKAIQYAQPEHRLLLLFDQFEELFSYPNADIRAFKTELAELLRQQPPERYERMLDIAAGQDQELLSEAEENQLYAPLNIRILFSIRSDRLHLLDQLSDYLPAVLKNNYELLALTPEAARRALVVPAGLEDGHFEASPFAYTEDANAHIIDFLRDEDNGLVEAIQLQILCTSFEDRAISEGIRTFDRATVGDLKGIIEDFYHRQLQKIPDDATRLAAAKLLEEGLIDKSRKQRLTLHESQIWLLFGVAPALLHQLVDYNLLRREPDRREGYTYELSHDTLIAPALAAREKREAEQAKAEREQQAAELAEEKRKRRRSWQIAIFMGVLALLSLLASGIAYWQYQEAQEATASAEQQRLEAEAATATAKEKEAEAIAAAQEAATQRELAELLADTAQMQRELAEAEAAKGRLLERTLASENAYGYLVETGKRLYEQGEYRDALTYWANARFLRRGSTIDRFIRTVKDAIVAENHFQNGELDLAYEQFGQLLDEAGLNDAHSQKRRAQVVRSKEVWEASTAGKRLDAIRYLTLKGDLAAFPKEAQQLKALSDLVIEDNKEENLFFQALANTADSISLINVGFTNIPESLQLKSELSSLSINGADRIVRLPESISQLNSLKSLVISYNAALSALPQSLGQLNNLQSLVIHGNAVLPQSLGQLNNLQSLRISYNDALSSLPQSLDN